MDLQEGSRSIPGSEYHEDREGSKAPQGVLGGKRRMGASPHSGLAITRIDDAPPSGESQVRKALPALRSAGQVAEPISHGTQAVQCAQDGTNGTRRVPHEARHVPTHLIHEAGGGRPEAV